ncbi:MAG: 4Fe-4S binding protein [Chitinophagaceae bacterium]
MALKITDDCISCGACAPECPNNAIYESGITWRIADGTKAPNPFKLLNGTAIDPSEPQEPLSEEAYFIVTEKCTECKGFHDEPQCAAVCPVSCCIIDENHEETEQQLLQKKQLLHG